MFYATNNPKTINSNSTLNIEICTLRACECLLSICSLSSWADYVESVWVFEEKKKVRAQYLAHEWYTRTHVSIVVCTLQKPIYDISNNVPKKRGLTKKKQEKRIFKEPFVHRLMWNIFCAMEPTKRNNDNRMKNTREKQHTWNKTQSSFCLRICATRIEMKLNLVRGWPEIKDYLLTRRRKTTNRYEMTISFCCCCSFCAFVCVCRIFLMRII